MENVYRGTVSKNRYATVIFNTQPLPMTKLAKLRSPDGFAWGYGGSGPFALAHSLIAHALNSTQLADKYAEQFKWEAIATFPQNEPFSLPQKLIIQWVQFHEGTLDYPALWGELSKTARLYLFAIAFSGGVSSAIPPEELLTKRLVTPYGFQYVVTELGQALVVFHKGKDA